MAGQADTAADRAPTRPTCPRSARTAPTALADALPRRGTEVRLLRAFAH
ncbi:hypothetical protein [Streptomyces sp. NPDC001222]